MNLFDFAKERAKGELSNPINKDVFVTVPDGCVYLNSSPEAIKNHIKEQELDVIHLKIDGVIQQETKEIKTKKLNGK